MTPSALALYASTLIGFNQHLITDNDDGTISIKCAGKSVADLVEVLLQMGDIVTEAEHLEDNYWRVTGRAPERVSA